MKNKIYAILGPTASGKTTFAIKLAKKFNCEIISLDSMQIYKKLDIGTAKIKINEMQGIKHYMIDIVEPDKEYSAGQFKEDAKIVIEKIFQDNKNVLLCGGTGLYFESLIYDYTFSNTQKNIEYRKHLENILEKEGANQLYKMLENVNIEKAKLTHKNNIQRVIRYLEVEKFKDKNIKDKKELKYDIKAFFLNPERKFLYENINKRVDEMFEKGLYSEFLNVKKEYNLTFNNQSMKAIGYREFKDVDKLSFDEIKENIKKNTRHYAKRQITWFKKYDFLKVLNYKNSQEFNQIIEEICND